MRILAETTDQDDPSQRFDTVKSSYDLSSLTDGDLLDAWNQDQQPQALATLVQRYSVMVLSVCRRRCRSDADAEDAFQTTFLYLARNGEKIRHPERLAGWLHRVAQRASVATWKSSQRESEPMVEPPANPDDPLERLTQRHEAIVLDEELADLPEHYRSALVMHIYDDHPLQHLAEHFGTTIGSIRGRLQRGKKLLARRLRHRGVVPVLAMAAANSWTAPDASAADAAQNLIANTGEGILPDPPVQPALFEPLLSQGVRLMPSLYTAAGILGGTALLALVVNGDGTSNGHSPETGPETIAISQPVVGQFHAIAPQVATQPQNAERKKNRRKKNQSNEDPAPNVEVANGQVGGGAGLGGGGGGGGLGGGLGPTTPPMVWSSRPVIPAPTSKVAEAVTESLDADANFEFVASLIELPEKLSELAGVPVLMDDRATQFAELKLADEQVRFTSPGIPLRTVLRRVLQPLGLKAVVENEGLVITADPAALVHKGIGTTRWINVNDKAARMIAEKLQQPFSLEFDGAPLRDVIKAIEVEYEFPIAIDSMAMEEIGLADDTPITCNAAGVQLKNALALCLSDLDLTMTMKGESLVVTTMESAEEKPLHRIYWLESTGIAKDDFDTIMSLITTTIEPDTWAEMGGSSTMAPMGSNRPALLISTTLDVHNSIDNLFQTLRETHFGVDPVMERVQVPAAPNQWGQFGGGMGGGLGGGGMGGGGFF